jgi:hypothetical protein
VRVRLIGQMSGTRDGVDWPPRGSVIELPDDEARALIGGRMAVEMAADPPPVERTVLTKADVEERVVEVPPGPVVTPDPVVPEPVVPADEPDSVNAESLRPARVRKPTGK